MEHSVRNMLSYKTLSQIYWEGRESHLWDALLWQIQYFVLSVMIIFVIGAVLLVMLII